jgi:hypothetical protein
LHGVIDPSENGGRAVEKRPELAPLQLEPIDEVAEAQVRRQLASQERWPHGGDLQAHLAKEVATPLGARGDAAVPVPRNPQEQALDARVEIVDERTERAQLEGVRGPPFEAQPRSLDLAAQAGERLVLRLELRSQARDSVCFEAHG